MNEKKETLRIEILKYIEKNSRVNLGELAVMLGVEETDVANEMAEMEKDKIICGYHTLIDWDRAGMEKVTALIEVRVTPQRDRGFDRRRGSIIIRRSTQFILFPEATICW